MILRPSVLLCLKMSQYDAEVEEFEEFEWFDRSVKENSLRAIVYDLECELLIAVDAEEKSYLEVHLNMFKDALSLYDKENNLIDLRLHLGSQLNLPLSTQASQHILSQIQSVDKDLNEVQLEIQLTNMTL